MTMNTYPVDEIVPDLQEAVRRNGSVVVHAPPGAGKTTRLPLFLLDVIPPERGRIIMLEPRRIAAVSAARWMARTLGEEAGETVGYSIRFDHRVSRATRIEVVTEGILTRRLQTDPGLDGVAMVIFDEFHERSLHADLAMALCLDVRRSLREDLKVIVMSATLDCEPVASLLGGAPVISSGGKAFPVEERYLADRHGKPLKERITDAVRTALSETSGDILIFLPGSGEIRACAEALRAVVGNAKDGLSVHPLYGDLPFEEQERAILPSRRRKIVLATNIAETSLTIEGVRVVIDSGLTRRLQHDPPTGMNRLITVSVSKASAEQRKGRAGRLGPGVCFRLFSRRTFETMTPYTPPEILVSDLSSAALELALWGVKVPTELPWLDVPPRAAWEAASDLLKDLGALDPSGSVTEQGKAMARLPLHPRLARMLLRSEELGCPGLGAELASLLSERDILRHTRADSAAQEREPDIAERIGVLRAWRKQRETPVWADPWALRMIDRASQQLMRLVSGTREIPADEPEDPDMIPRLLLCAFPDRIGRRREDSDCRFILSRGRGVRVPTTSALRMSPFVVAVNVDAGEKREGVVHIASPLTDNLIRQECAGRVETVRRVEWDQRQERIVATVEERIGAVLLSSKPFYAPDEEVKPLLCDAIRSSRRMLPLSREVRQFQCRVGLMRRFFPDESWPDLSEERLMSRPEEWLMPYAGGIRSAQDLARVDILPALRAVLTRQQVRLLDERAPLTILVPSGHRAPIDYTAGETPVLAVKLQEMFGLADTPVIAGGRVKVLLHLLSPARRPVQITQDLRAFWNSGYQQVKKELKGRYPKHPWPDDPWNAAPTGRTKTRNR